jgi:predicted RNase H-like HicB family nuclease
LRSEKIEFKEGINSVTERFLWSKRLMTKWRVILEPDPQTGDWAIWCPELPGCVSAGETEQEAIENIREAIKLYLEPEPIELEPGAITQEILI